MINFIFLIIYLSRVIDVDQPGLGMAREYLMKGVEDPDVKVS